MKQIDLIKKYQEHAMSFALETSFTETVSSIQALPWINEPEKEALIQAEFRAAAFVTHDNFDPWTHLSDADMADSYNSPTLYEQANRPMAWYFT